ncbi:PEP-CTERM sorting domain-containing protein [Adhaeretor mobilis]|uniref:PEP-CTERM protein-sorting domain-containing protein n=1 Tax=Adhaeretor mobilis TaxID=1930276 RepID=A0A517MVB3_9BACT|nr:PEP-CTERM sorting domain-containing protein [Adhaeretor mobilis]QDS98815.1 hypothetical protein HG15A2_21000 [Adhaeretor mobilis]
MLKQRQKYRPAMLILGALAASCAARSAIADLVVHFDPNVLSTQFFDGSTSGGNIPAIIGDTVGFMTDVRATTPGAAGAGDGWVDAEGSITGLQSRPEIVPHLSQGTVWSVTGGQRLLGRIGASGNTDGVEANFDQNTMSAVVVGRVDASGSGQGYLFDFRDDAATGGGSNANDGFALRYDYASGMLQGVAKQTVNASVAMPTGEWFVASYAWDGAAGTATVNVNTISGFTASNTTAAETAALAPDRWRPVADASGNQGFYGKTGDLMLYNDVLDHSAVASQLIADYFNVPELLINRDSGEITISNANGANLTNVVGYKITSEGGALNPAQWTSIAGNYDAGSPGASQVDPDNNWTELSGPANRTDLSEATFESNGSPSSDGADFLHGNATSLGDAWFQYYDEGGIAAELLFADGDVAPLDVRFTGNGGNPFAYGDLNFDGVIDQADFNGVFLPNYGADTSSLVSNVEKYRAGDLDEDGKITLEDFVRLNNAYLTANPGAAALSLAAVPEPSSLLLLSLIVGGAAFGRRRFA